jgi:hypothetical protein
MTHTLKSLFRLCAVTFFIPLLTACGDGESSDEHEGEDPAEHACEHASEEGSSVVASETPEDAPLLELGDEPYTVTLTPGAEGYVKLAAPAEALLFAGTSDVVSELTFEGSDILPEGSPNEFCEAEIPEHFDLDLDEPGDYVLRLGPSGVDSVWLMYVSAEGHAAH